MTPWDAAMREITIEMEAARNRTGNGPMPEKLMVRIEFDRETGMPRNVEVDESRRRRILGGAVPARMRAR